MSKKPVKYFVVDAFTDSAFKGNPAAICLLEEEREEKWLQAVAAEFNISDTGYLIRINEEEEETDDSLKPPMFSLRWFTPTTEVELCGHATLAAAHILFSSDLVNSNIIEFSTLSGILTAKKVFDKGESQEINYFIELDFPAISSVELNSADVSSISKALNVSSIVDIKMSKVNFDNLLVVLRSEKDVEYCQPNFDEIRKFPGSGIIVTAVPVAESKFDFYTRYFCPKLGVNEDPVCGSVHCALAVYWAEKLGKSDFVAYMDEDVKCFPISDRNRGCYYKLEEVKVSTIFVKGRLIGVAATVLKLEEGEN